MESEAAICQHLHDESHHITVWDGLQPLKMESTVPHSVVSSYQDDEHGSSFFSSLEFIFDALGDQVHMVSDAYQKPACSFGNVD